MPLRYAPFLLALVLPACSSPDHAPPTTRPRTGWPASPPYQWPGSLPPYFPVAAGVNPDHIQPGDTARSVPITRLSDCHSQYEYAASCLAAARAPVLATATANPAVYRFIWLRSFHRPVLLTLTCSRAGGLLETSFLSKPPGMAVPTLPDPDAPGLPPRERARLLRFVRQRSVDPEWLATVAFAKAPVKLQAAKARKLSAAQVQQLRQQVERANFWQLPSCQTTAIFDGAYWFLEVREAGRYHVVFRHSPDEGDAYRRCGELLLGWSPARREERY